MTAVATFWPQPTVATKFWRCEVPARYLPGKLAGTTEEEILAESQFGPDGMPALPSQEGDVAIYQFPARPGRLGFIQTQMIRGLRVLYECDDNYLVVPPHLPPPYTRNDIIYEPPHAPEDPRSSIRLSRHAATLAHGVIASTKYLEKLYRRECNPYTYYCPNCIDPADWPTPEDHHQDGVFRVGIVASISHFHDLPLVASALEWASKQDGVEVLTVGCDHPSWLSSHQEIPYIPDFEHYRKVFSLFDVVMCPVMPSDWSRARSDNKIIESAMGGAMSIISPADPFCDWVDTEYVRTVKVNSQSGFRRELEWAVKHQDEVRDIAKACRQKVLETRTIQDNIWRWHDACEWPAAKLRRGVRKRPTFAAAGNQGTEYQYARALAKARWRPANPPHADLLLVDYPVEFWGPRWHFIRDVKVAGGLVGEIPHGMMPMVTLDGAVEYHPDVDFSVVPAEGWAELYRAMGITRPMVVSGWTASPIADWKPLAGKPGRVLFAPIHPNRTDGKTTLDWALDLNTRAYKMLVAGTGYAKTVRFMGEDEPNGIHRRVNGVEYVEVDPILVGPDWTQIDEADLVISYGSFLFLSLARGRPCVALRDVPPIRDDGTVVARNFDAWKALWEYPVKIDDAPTVAGLAALVRERDAEIRAWRDRYIGEAFDEAGFVEAMEGFVYDREQLKVAA